MRRRGLPLVAGFFESADEVAPRAARRRRGACRWSSLACGAASPSPADARGDFLEAAPLEPQLAVDSHD